MVSASLPRNKLDGYPAPEVSPGNSFASPLEKYPILGGDAAQDKGGAPPEFAGLLPPAAIGARVGGAGEPRAFGLRTPYNETAPFTGRQPIANPNPRTLPFRGNGGSSAFPPAHLGTVRIRFRSAIRPRASTRFRRDSPMDPGFLSHGRPKPRISSRSRRIFSKPQEKSISASCIAWQNRTPCDWKLPVSPWRAQAFQLSDVIA